MPAWVFNSNTGQEQLNTAPMPETEEEKKKRQQQKDNRLPGQAGTGLMFTQTAGGVQRSYNPATAATQPRVAPTSGNVSTGRSAPLTEAERLKQQSLNNIINSTGTSTGGLLNRLNAISGNIDTTKSNAESNSNLLGSPSGTLTRGQLDALVRGTNSYDTLMNSLIRKLTEESTAKKNELLGDTSNQLSDIESLANTYRGTLADLNLPGSLDSYEGATAKERAGIAKANSRLRDTGLDVTSRAATSNIVDALSGAEQEVSDYGTLEGILQNLVDQSSGKVYNAYSNLPADIQVLKSILQPSEPNMGTLGVTPQLSSAVTSYSDEDLQKLREIYSRYGIGY